MNRLGSPEQILGTFAQGDARIRRPAMLPTRGSPTRIRSINADGIGPPFGGKRTPPKPLAARAMPSGRYKKLMKHTRLAILALCALLPIAAVADRDKDESGHGKHGKGRAEYKHEYSDGHCKVERKLEKNGNYKEERKCRAPQHGPATVYVPAPVHVPAPPTIVIEPGLVIQGTVRIK